MKAQIVKCKGCGQIFAACVEPFCYTEKDWLRNLKKYVQRGDIVEMVDSRAFVFGKCVCVKVKSKPAPAPTLFETL